MMIEEKLLSAMMNAERAGAIQTACEYSKNYCIFVGVQEKDLPIKPLSNLDARNYHGEWNQYYFNLMETWGKRITANLIEVRKKYGGKNRDIPDMEKKKE